MPHQRDPDRGVPDRLAIDANRDRLRAAYGRGAQCWVVDGPPASEAEITLSWLPTGWSSLLVYGADQPCLEDALRRVTATRRRAMLHVTGRALGNVQVLADAGWVCIGQRPFMHRAVPSSADAEHPGSDAITELSSPAELARASDLVAEVLGSGMDIPAEALAGAHGNTPRIWGLWEAGEIVSCATTIDVGDAITVWNVATWPALHRRGYGRRLLSAVHQRCDESRRNSEFLLSASDAGYRLYETLGYQAVEYWQAWSRPRWVLGRA